jgi:DNA-binding Lrp family transcriptional regulator
MEAEMAATGESDWRSLGRDSGFCAAFVFMDEATQNIFTIERMRPADISQLATNMSRTAANPNLVFAHALVGPADIVVGVEAESIGKLAETIQGIRKSVDGDKFVHRVQSHVIVSTAGRINFSKDAFHGETRPPAGMRAWVLATAATRRPDEAATRDDPPADGASGLEATLRKNDHVKLLARVLGAYDYFIYVEAADMREMQDVIDQCIRANSELMATDTRIVMHERGT